MALYKKTGSRYYWYDFKLRDKRYRSSTKETDRKRAGKIAALRLSQAIGRRRPVGPEGSQDAGVLDSFFDLGRIGSSRCCAHEQAEEAKDGYEFRKPK